MDVQVLRVLIQNTLKPLVLYSVDAEELLMATCAQESLLGTFRHQVNGPALGIYQMDPADFYDIWQSFLAYRTALKDELSALATTSPARPIELQENDRFATAMARVHYLRCPRPIPACTDLNGLWMYYKVNWNSVEGAATQDQFYRNYHALVKGPAL